MATLNFQLANNHAEFISFSPKQKKIDVFSSGGQPDLR